LRFAGRRLGAHSRDIWPFTFGREDLFVVSVGSVLSDPGEV
jgi:hypothetical protein